MVAIRRARVWAAGVILVASASPAAAQLSCPAGVRTVLASTASAAAQALVRGSADAALLGAQAAVGAEPTNAANHRLLARVYAALGRFADSEAAFREAERLCPAYAAETRAARLEAANAAFQSGLEAYQRSDTRTAVTRWEEAGRLSAEAYSASYNLGVVLQQQGRPADAAGAYRRALEGMAGVAGSAPERTQEAASDRYRAVSGLVSAGAALFQAGSYVEAADLFRYVTEKDPGNRDAWANRALALYKLERAADLVPVAQRVVAMDPLNQNAHVILFNAYKSLHEAARARADGAEEQRLRRLALDALDAGDTLPVSITGIDIENRDDGSARVTGVVHAGTAPAGHPIRLDFSLHTSGTTHSRTITVTAPAKDATARFEIEVPSGGPITSYAYDVR